MLRRRRAAIINKQSVPYGMEKVEYLQTGEAGPYLKTDVIVNDYGDNFGFRTNFLYTDADGAWVTNILILGARKSSMVENIELSRYGGGMLRWGTEEKHYNFSINKLITAEFKNLEFNYKIDGVEKQRFSYTAGQTLAKVPFYLFALNQNESVMYRAKNTRIYDVIFYNADKKYLIIYQLLIKIRRDVCLIW